MRITRLLPWARPVADVAGAVLTLAVILVLLAGFGVIPSLGRVLNPATGVWRSSAASVPAQPRTIHLSTLRGEASILFENNGIAHLRADDDSDLFRLVGYVHAQYRLGQMDLARRTAAGQLSEVIGPAALDSDGFELELGLRHAAEADWASMAADDPARIALLAYADGVNAARLELIADHRLSEVFKVLDYEPRPWSPVDSLMIQRVLTQRLSLSDRPLLFSYIASAVNDETFRAWFPDAHANPQNPYDVGPYQRLPLSPLSLAADRRANRPDIDDAGIQAAPAAAAASPPPRRLAALPAGAMHQFGNSNSWVLSGDLTESGEPLLATDPHLDFALPAIWYQLEARSPGYAFSGVTIPGVPVPLMGKTDTFAWGITNSQRPTSLYYIEETDPARPNEYRWRGQWWPMQTVTYDIAVRGQRPVQHTVNLTVHGPVVQLDGITASLWWGGALPSGNVRAVLDLLRSKDITAARASMAGWATPPANITYADRNGTIAAFNVGVAPQVPPGVDVTMPLPGDGSADVVGAIAHEALPATINPPSGVIVAANQTEVTGDYPYQYSRSYNFSDPGWRASEILLHLNEAGKASVQSAAELQSDAHDNLARTLIPILLRALDGQQLDETESIVRDALAEWDYAMAGDALAQFFYIFNHRVTYVTLRPWFDHFQVPDDPELRGGLYPDIGSFGSDTLYGTVSSWLLHDPQNRFLALPDGSARGGDAILVEAFRQSVRHVVEHYNPSPDAWRGEPYHWVLFPSVLRIPGLDVGPFPSGGGDRTVNAALGTVVRDGTPIPNTATAGATWRFIVDWGTGEARSIYPGGQSESPLSPWYVTGVQPWLAGEYWATYDGAEAEAVSPTHWRFLP